MDMSPILILHFGLQLFSLSEVMINEASVDGEIGMIAVAQTVINRSKREGRWGTDIWEIVHEPSSDPSKPWACAFSYTCDKKPDIVLEKDIDAYFAIMPIASKIMRGEIDDITLGADHYVKCGVTRSWLTDMTFTVKIGRHCFYKEN